MKVRKLVLRRLIAMSFVPLWIATVQIVLKYCICGEWPLMSDTMGRLLVAITMLHQGASHYFVCGIIFGKRLTKMLFGKVEISMRLYMTLRGALLWLLGWLLCLLLGLLSGHIAADWKVMVALFVIEGLYFIGEALVYYVAKKTEWLFPPEV